MRTRNVERVLKLKNIVMQRIMLQTSILLRFSNVVMYALSISYSATAAQIQKCKITVPL